MSILDFTNRLAIPSHVLIRHLDGESVLLNLRNERYYGLDATGTRMWEVATTQPTIELAYKKLLEEFEVEPQILKNHFEELLSGLVENGLLQMLPADVGTTSTV